MGWVGGSEGRVERGGGKEVVVRNGRSWKRRSACGGGSVVRVGEVLEGCIELRPGGVGVWRTGRGCAYQWVLMAEIARAGAEVADAHAHCLTMDCRADVLVEEAGRWYGRSTEMFLDARRRLEKTWGKMRTSARDGG
jgi:hypothetical protein